MMSTKIKNYRPDIDGLRAVAVLSVVIFHLNESWLKGGFLGVDIFFVISGYLIGGLLFRELSTHTFSLKTFYLRRIRRILPAFFAMLIITTLVAVFLIPPYTEESGYHRSFLEYSLLFANNIGQAFKVDYFHNSLEILPLKHIWSLAVEEQFYFVFPLVLWLLIKGLNKIVNNTKKTVNNTFNNSFKLISSC